MIFADIPAIVRLFLVLVVIFWALRKNLSLGNSFFLGCILLMVAFEVSPRAAYGSVAASASNPKTIFLAVIVSLILILSNSMEKAGQMKRLFDAYQGLFDLPRVNLAIFPALIGLLPMPGGAVFSAPMLKALGKDTDLKGGDLSYINNWFRHVWEYWWPLYPGVLLTATLSGLNLWYFALFMLPLTALSVIYGFFPLSHLRKAGGTPAPRDATARVGPFLWELRPIVIVIAGGLLAGLALAFFLPSLKVAKELGLVISLLLALGWVVKVNRLRKREFAGIVTDPKLLNMIYMVLAILIFKGLVEDSRAVHLIAGEFQGLHFPLVMIAALLPLLVGLAVGITIGTMGSTLPIVISLVESYGEGHHLLAYMMLSLSWGFLGTLISPLHICLTLSNQYFSTSLGAVYRLMLPPTAFTLISALTYFFFLRWLA